MHFLIVGPGAMGCLFGARLKLAGQEVTLLDHRRQRARNINRRGLVVDGVTGSYRADVPAVVEGPPVSPDVVLVCVKSYHTRKAALRLREFLAPGVPVVTLQNGLGNVDVLADVFGRRHVLGGVTAEGATLQDDGRITHAGQGETVIGPKAGTDAGPDTIAAALTRAGFHATVSDGVEGLIWGKLVINVGINALAAITRLPNGRLPEIQGTLRIMIAAVKEAVAVAKAGQIDLPYPDPVKRVTEVCRATSGNIASMLQDVLREKPTEIDFINGAIVREGRLLHIPTPVNETLTCLVQAIQASYSERVP